VIRTEDYAQVRVTEAAALWAWLEAHHTQTESVWLVTPKKVSGTRAAGPFVGREDVLDALVAHGWIDGIRRKLDDAWTMQLISPRRQRAWAQSYKDRAARLQSEGRMHPAGARSVAEGKASGLWDHMADVDRLEVPDDLMQALAARGDAAAWWAQAAPSYRRNALRWIKSAKRPETRAKRIAETAAQAARGEKVAQL